jgi:hypothetical protein
MQETEKRNAKNGLLETKRAQAEACATKRKNAGKMPAVQNRNAPAGAGAQFLTGRLYHSGNTGQVKLLGQGAAKRP